MYILVVEDDFDQAAEYQSILGSALPAYNVLRINDLEGAFGTFAPLSGQIHAIIIDGTLPEIFNVNKAAEESLTARPFIEHVKKQGFKYLMVAASDNQDHLHAMVQAGCNNGVAKREAAQVVIDYLQGDFL